MARVRIIIEGGKVRDVYGSDPEVDVEVIDLDTSKGSAENEAAQERVFQTATSDNWFEVL